MFSILVCLGNFSILPAYGQDNEVDLSNFPNQLASKLNIPLFAAKLLATSIVLAIFLFPVVLLTKNPIAHMFIGLVVMGFCIAMDWLPVWFLLVVCMVIALMFSGKMRDWITGGA